MEIRASFLAVVAVTSALGLSADPGRAQDAQGANKQAPATAPTAMPAAESLRDSRSPAGAAGAPQSSGIETQRNVVGGGAGLAKDPPVNADSDKNATGQSGLRSRTGSETSKPETGAEHQPSIKPAPGNSAKEGIWSSPIDASVAVHQGRKSNKDSKSTALPGRALLGNLLNKSRSATTLGVARHHDAPKPQQKLLGGGQGEPARNAIGAHIEHRAMAHHDAALLVGISAVRSVAPQGTGTPSLDAQGRVSAPTPGTVASGRYPPGRVRPSGSTYGPES